MRAVKRATDEMFADPKAAWVAFCDFKPVMDTPLNEKIYERYVEIAGLTEARLIIGFRSFTYMSRDAGNVERDWTKVVM